MNVDDIVNYLASVDEEAELLLSMNNGIHNMHGYRHGIRGGIANIQNELYHDETKASFSRRFDAMSNMDFLIRTMRQCNVLGRFPSKSETLPKRTISSWYEVGK